MSLTIDITDINEDLVTDTPADTSQDSTPACTVDGWLYALWGLRPGVSLRATPAAATHPYPPQIAEWLYHLWGISVPDASMAPVSRSSARA